MIVSFRWLFRVWQLIKSRHSYVAPSFIGPVFGSLDSGLMRNAEIGVLVGLLMQYPCGRIKAPWIGQLRFALLPGDARGGGGAMKLAPVERTLWICVSDVTEEWPSRCSIHNVGRFLDADGEEVDGETAPFLSAFAITRCYRSGFQSSVSERQRERSSRSPLAAPLYLSPRQVSRTGEATVFVIVARWSFPPMLVS